LEAIGEAGEATWHSDRGGSAKTGRARRGGNGTRTSVAGVTLSHPGKVLFASPALAKRDLALYYESIADWILPHLEGRPLTLVRCPEGAAGDCFYQKHIDASAPESIDRVKITESGGRKNYPVANTLAAVIALAQMGALELHTWGCTAPRIEKPDRIVFDLDPDPALEWIRV